MTNDDLDRRGRGLISRYTTGIRLEGDRKTTKLLTQDRRSPGRDMNTEPPEYEAGGLTTRS
jgi:hypothetical protein